MERDILDCKHAGRTGILGRKERRGKSRKEQKGVGNTVVRIQKNSHETIF